MIFLAVAGPTPFSASRSFSLALLRSTFAPAGAAIDMAGLAAGAAIAAGAGAAADAPPTATSGVMAVIVFAVRPAFDRSATLAYGRPAMIFLAVAAPTPGNATSCACVALFRSTFAPAGAAALACAPATAGMAAMPRIAAMAMARGIQERVRVNMMRLL